MATRIDDVLLVPMTGRREARPGWILIEDGVIVELGPDGASRPEARRVVSGEGRALLPGFVQSHVHLCQTLFRGAAENLALLEWLRLRIWPLEAAHDEETLAASVRLAALELVRGGTTSVLTMETVRGTDAVLETLSGLPLRAVVGKCLMDMGEGVPPGLLEDPDRGLEEALRTCEAAVRLAPNRLWGCLAPRFALSCSEALLRDVGAEAEARGLLVHTHGAEQEPEVEEVLRATGRRNVEYLDQVGLVTDRLRLAHAVHLSEREVDMVAERAVRILHCPGSNLKLGSGIAPVARYMERGIRVSAGADGAPCNNSLDALREARLAALLQKMRFGPQAMDSWTALELVTSAGADALGLGGLVGTLEPGKRADLVEIDLTGPHMAPAGDVADRIVFAADRSDVRRVWFDGEVVVEEGQPLFADPEATTAEAERAFRRLVDRAGL